VSGSARRDGVLVVDKPRGPTSHDIVAHARRHFATRQVGHAGTLDPMATGVLVLLLGEATKLSEIATGCDKSYAAEVRFGHATDTDDAEGTTTEALLEPPSIDPAALECALEAERQRTEQQPPSVSALKVNGRRAYELVRSGQSPELEPRRISVRSLQVLGFADNALRLELLVSKGYYVRALARDLGRALGVPAHLSALRRLSSGAFALADACSWPPPASREPLTLAEAVPRLVPTLRLGPAGILRARAGQRLEREDFVDDPELAVGEAGHGLRGPRICAWTDLAGIPIALGQHDQNGFRVKRGFAAERAVESVPAMDLNE
jgi:tRNA pseudouridine55 synthase